MGPSIRDYVNARNTDGHPLELPQLTRNVDTIAGIRMDASYQNYEFQRDIVMVAKRHRIQRYNLREEFYTAGASAGYS